MDKAKMVRKRKLENAIAGLENLQREIIDSSEWVFGDAKVDGQYIKTLRRAIDLLENDLKKREGERV